MVAPRIVIAVALTWPLGALAVDPVSGAETDGGKATGVAGWTGRQDKQAETEGLIQEARGQSPGIWRAPLAVDASGHFYHYGQREPSLEELVSADRVPR
jgi:hypothetical protein